MKAKIPIDLIQFLEDQDFFGHTKQDFMVNAVKCYLSCQITEMTINEREKLRQKYGELVDIFFNL